jgi:hypothetical protein
MSNTKSNHDRDPKVFLGGVSNGDSWRNKLIPLLSIDFYNPEAEEDTDRGRMEKVKQRKKCDFHLYVITPEVKGLYWVAEVVDDSNKNPEKTILCILNNAEEAFTDGPLYRSMWAIADLVQSNGAAVFTRLEQVAAYIQIKTRLEDYKIMNFDSGETSLDISRGDYIVAKVNVPDGYKDLKGIRIDPESPWKVYGGSET